MELKPVVDTLNSNAGETSQKACSYYVAVALNAGLPPNEQFRNLDHENKGGPGHGKDWERNLTSRGFSNATETNYEPQVGDVAVIPPYKGDTRGADGKSYGHVAIWNGTQWVSDYKQSGGKNGASPYYYKPDSAEVKSGQAKAGDPRPLEGQVQYYRRGRTTNGTAE